jgi:hypothetical protein
LNEVGDDADHVTHVPGDGEVVVQAEERTAFGTSAIAMRRIQRNKKYLDKEVVFVVVTTPPEGLSSSPWWSVVLSVEKEKEEVCKCQQERR